MTLYHNADINDLEAICRDGLVSLDVSKNDKWEEGHRADNRTDIFFARRLLKIPSSTSAQLL